MMDTNATGPVIIDDAALENVRGGARLATVNFGIDTTSFHGDDDDPDADKPVKPKVILGWDIAANRPG